MTTELATRDLPKDEKTGLTLPLSASLTSQELAQHHAMVALELEVLAKKYDRFGWERDRGSVAHDRMITDWMDAFQDYPLDEVRSACAAAVLENPNNMPNEGHIRAEIANVRKHHVQRLPKPTECERPSKRVTPEKAAEIIAAAGYGRQKAGWPISSPSFQMAVTALAYGAAFATGTLADLENCDVEVVSAWNQTGGT